MFFFATKAQRHEEALRLGFSNSIMKINNKTGPLNICSVHFQSKFLTNDRGHQFVYDIYFLRRRK